MGDYTCTSFLGLPWREGSCQALRSLLQPHSMKVLSSGLAAGKQLISWQFSQNVAVLWISHCSLALRHVVKPHSEGFTITVLCLSLCLCLVFLFCNQHRCSPPAFIPEAWSLTGAGTLHCPRSRSALLSGRVPYLLLAPTITCPPLAPVVIPNREQTGRLQHGNKWGPHHVSLAPFCLGITRHPVLLERSTLESYLAVYYSLLLTLGLPTCLWSAEYQGSVTGGTSSHDAIHGLAPCKHSACVLELGFLFHCEIKGGEGFDSDLLSLCGFPFQEVSVFFCVFLPLLLMAVRWAL